MRLNMANKAMSSMNEMVGDVDVFMQETNQPEPGIIFKKEVEESDISKEDDQKKLTNRFCSNCGAIARGNFCSNCGTKIK